MVCNEEYVDAILGGLLSNYAPIVSVTESKKCTRSIAEIRSLRLWKEWSPLTPIIPWKRTLFFPWYLTRQDEILGKLNYLWQIGEHSTSF